MKFLKRLKLDSWIEKNPEPMWNGRVVIYGFDENSKENKQRLADYDDWSIKHHQWVKELLKYLGVQSHFHFTNEKFKDYND